MEPVNGRGASAYPMRLHVRYDAKSFPEDLALMETGDRTNFQGSYILRHPWQGKLPGGEQYRASSPLGDTQRMRMAMWVS